MASRPSLYPYWASTTTNLTGTGNTNKVRPKVSLRDIGWDLGQQPTCEEFNWQLNNIDQWVEYLDSVVFAATASDTANTLALRDSNSSFSVKQLTSTAPNGTKPFIVTSTTKVDNLNADLLDGMTTTSAATVSTVAARDINGNTSFNRVLLGDGSAANPSLTFNSDGATDTGLYHSADGIMNISVNGVATGSFQADGLHMPLKGNADTVSSISGNISILTGTLSSGSTIPLPSGYIESQCHWTAGVASAASTSSDMQQINCVISGRVVTVYGEDYTGTFNYIIIGIK
jgi:hypothetical protein